MEHKNLYLVFQVAAGLITSQIVWLATDSARNFAALLMAMAIIILTTAAIVTGRMSAREEGRSEAGPKKHAVVTTSLRGCYEIILMVNGDSTHEDLGDDTHLLHGENFNMLVKRVDGVLHVEDDNGRKIQIHLSASDKSVRDKAIPGAN